MGDFDDAIAILQAAQLEAEAVYTATDDYEAMHTADEFYNAIKLLKRSSKSDIITKEQMIQNAITCVRTSTGEEVYWNGKQFITKELDDYLAEAEQ